MLTTPRTTMPLRPLAGLVWLAAASGCFDPPSGEETAGTESASSSGTTTPAPRGESSEGGGASSTGGDGSASETTATPVPGTSSGETTVASTPGSSSGGDGLACVESEVGTGVGVTFDSRNRSDRFSLTCGAGTGSDVAFTWTAPSTDYYAFSTVGGDGTPASTYDTVVGLFEGGCDGAEVGCANGGPQGEAQALLVHRVTEGETYLVVVDGNSGGRGDGSLRIDPVACPESDVTGQALPVDLTTTGGSDNHAGEVAGLQCGSGAGRLDRSIRYVAPEAGQYRFSVQTSDFSPTLYLYEGAACGGAPVSCNENTQGGHPATVTRHLEAGQAMTAVVESDADGGSFVFDVQRIETTTCPDLPELGAGVTGVVLDTMTAPNELEPSCAWAGNALQSYPEFAYAFTVENTGVSSCQVEITLSDTGSPALTAYLLEGDGCDGRELRCTTDAAVDLLTVFEFSGIADNGRYTVVVENQDSFDTPLQFDITSTCTD